MMDETEESKGKWKLEPAGGEVGQSPWAQPREQDPVRRVVGWRGGEALTAAAVKELVSHDKSRRKQYKKLSGMCRRAPAPPRSEEENKVQDLPPTWVAIYSTVPDHDPRPVYKKWQKEKQAEAQGLAPADSKKKKRKGPLTEDDEAERKLAEETKELEEKVRSKKAVLAEKEKACVEWERKLAKVRKMDKEEEVRSRVVIRRLEKSSYAYGVLEGQMKSSDAFFTFMEMDTKADHAKKMATLSRSVAMLGTQIDNLKTEVRSLLKAEAETPKRKQRTLSNGESGTGGELEDSAKKGAGEERTAEEVPAEPEEPRPAVELASGRSAEDTLLAELSAGS